MAILPAVGFIATVEVCGTYVRQIDWLLDTWLHLKTVKSPGGETSRAKDFVRKLRLALVPLTTHFFFLSPLFDFVFFFT